MYSSPAMPFAPIQIEEQQTRDRYHTSLHLTRQDVLWLDGLATMYATNRSAIARLVLAEARRMAIASADNKQTCE